MSAFGRKADPLVYEYTALIDRDIRRLHHRTPDVRALLDHLAHPLRRGAERGGLEPEDALLHIDLLEAYPDRIGDLLGDLLWRAGRRRNRHPGDRGDARHRLLH